MRLSHLLEDIYPVPGSADCEILGLALDSRLIQPKDLFFAVRGFQFDGRKYMAQAIEKGAVAILYDVAAEEAGPLFFQQAVPIVPVPYLQKKIGLIAARFHHFPADKLRIIGVTGTSGKTSCTHFIAQLLQAAQQPCAIVGTLGNGFYPHLSEPGLTTPDALNLQATLGQLQQQGAKTVAMEVSSHSIEQERIQGVPFEIGIFTNLSRDHLDYHGDMETYAKVKRRFLAEFPTQHVIINADDEYGKKWLQELANVKPVFAYSTNPRISIPENIPLIYCDQTSLSFQAIQARLHTPWGTGKFHVPLIGAFNLSNILAIVTALNIYGIPFDEIVNLLSQLKAVPGRMQTLGGGNKPLVVVDYAHKPDALEKVLQALRAHIKGKIICVFGCGGDRDSGKRPLMGNIAEQLADQVIVTNDNPRHEKPEQITAEILRGFSRPDQVTVLHDRSKAIEKSIQWAKTDDCVLIAGKGAEHYQQIGDTKVTFDDVEHANKYLNN